MSDARPRIGVTLDWDNDERTVKHRMRDEGTYFLYAAYVEALVAAGGVPFLLPHLVGADVVAAALDGIDGLVITGGDFDIDPHHYGAAPSADLGHVIESRTQVEWALLDGAFARELPVLAVCGGEQLLNVACGGTLIQDISSEMPGALEHEQSTPKNETAHDVTVVEGTLLADVVGPDALAVNSTHHQAVKDIGEGLRANAIAPDGVIEGVEKTGSAFVVGVQWHPEILANTDSRQRHLFEVFVAKCRT